MPQLVRGGKHVFGWVVVGERGRVPVPPEATAEYGHRARDEIYVLSGSRTSGGFSLVEVDRFRGSRLAAILEGLAGLAPLEAPLGRPVELGDRMMCWTIVEEDGSVNIPPATLAVFDVAPGDRLLVARGSGLGPGFIVRGPILDEAVGHPELDTFS